MTLKQKFLPKMYCFTGSGMLTNFYDENVAQGNAKECEQIAEDFAIGFVEWFVLNYTEEIFYEENYTKELLEIYKKEKGL